MMNHALALKGFLLEIKHITSIHVSLAKAGHMAKPGIKKVGSRILPWGRKPDIVGLLYNLSQAANS